MMISPNDADGTFDAVLNYYDPACARASWTPLGNAGGFSGARLWRGTTAAGELFCLREWPVGRMTADRLEMIHLGMMALKALPFVPQLLLTDSGNSWVQFDDAFWEISTWMPGAADFHQNPTNTRLFAAMRSLAAIHRLLRPIKETRASCPAVKRIRRALRGWRELLQGGWKPDFTLPQPDPIPALGRRAWQAISADTYSIEFTLEEWEGRPLPLQYCLCDIWHDHILYENDAVSGIIDYGALKPDCVAVDLARLLGSMIPDQPERMQQALGIYTAIHYVPDEVMRLCAVLDQAGSVVGLTNWLRWLYLEKRIYAESAGVVKRMTALLNRVENKKPAAFSPWIGW